jgi:hypothetical protein
MSPLVMPPVPQMQPVTSREDVMRLLGKADPKLVSERSILTTTRLIADLQQNYHGLTLAKTIDNGDCFYDAVAQSLNELFDGQPPFSIQTLRKISSDFVNNPANENDPVLERIKKVLKKPQDLQEYKMYVHEDAAEAARNGRYPIWGNSQVDGRIYMKVLGINIRELAEGFLDEGAKGAALQDPDNRIFGDVLHRDPSFTPTFRPTALVANIPGHYYAVLGQLSNDIQRLVASDRETYPSGAR